MRFDSTLRVLAVALALCLGAGLARAGSVEDGRKHLADGKYADAAASFRKALESAPGSKDALVGLAKAATDGRLADAYEEIAGLLRDSLRKTPDDRDLRLALGRLYLVWSRVDQRWLADAEDQFGRLLKADPMDEDAAVGIARRWFEAADANRGLAVLDEFLGKKPTSAPALYWKGELLYDQASQAFNAGDGTVSPEMRALFEKALGSYEAATKADPKHFDAWIKTGYAAQYLAGTDASKIALAAAAYEKAIDLDGENEAPLRGLSRLYANKPTEWVEVVTALPKSHPKAPRVHFWHAWTLYSQKKFDDAERAVRTFVSSSRRPADGHWLLARILLAKKDEEGARKAFEASLEADPMHANWVEAVTKLEEPLVAQASQALGSTAQAKDLIRAYEALFALAPKHIWIRNNLGLVLRDAYTSGRAKDRAVLDASVRAYEEASALVGEWTPEYETTVLYPSRHQYAQVLNDTGLMYQYYPPIEDLAKAEAYYRKAMEWSQHGYWDTYGNLIKILKKQERWQDAYDFATACAEGLKNEKGDPQQTYRATASGEAALLEKKLKNE